MALQYLVHHPITRLRLAPPLNVDQPVWTELANGNGELSFKVSIPRDQKLRDILRIALEPDEAAIYVRSSDGQYPFAGIVIEQAWDKGSGTIAVKAVSIRSWLYSVFLGPLTDMTADVLYGWTQIDQLVIARDILTFAVAGGAGSGKLPISYNAAVSGKPRDLNIKGLDFKYAGELLETMSRRAGGFEWDVVARDDNMDGMPRLWFDTGFPEIGAFRPDIVLKSTPGGGNMRVKMPVTISSAGRRTRVWTTGNTETLPFAQDSDPALPNGGTLLREKSTNYSTVTDRTTLASHARAEREALTPKLNALSIELDEGAADIGAYRAGDRFRLIYKDEWYDLDLPSVRAMDRRCAPAGGAGTVEMVLDLNDYTIPEVDSGGTV